MEHLNKAHRNNRVELMRDRFSHKHKQILEKHQRHKLDSNSNRYTHLAVECMQRQDIQTSMLADTLHNKPLPLPQTLEVQVCRKQLKVSMEDSLWIRLVFYPPMHSNIRVAWYFQYKSEQVLHLPNAINSNSNTIHNSIVIIL